MVVISDHRGGGCRVEMRQLVGGLCELAADWGPATSGRSGGSGAGGG
ncbi:hypothetical protein [Pyrobaculum ferrireducens]|nr:hypothetical protein [Pyrobaculum ferrireducens]